VLAHQSQAASLVTAPHTEKARFKHLELIGTYGRQVLMVLVLAGGDVRQQMLSLAEPVAQERLSQAANTINDLCQGLDSNAVASISTTMDLLEQEVLRLVEDEMRRSGDVLGGEVYRDGLTHVLAEPEFAEVAARKALRILEERSLLEDLLTRTVLTSNVGGVQVLIGGEGTWDDLRQSSMLLSRYGVPGLATGTLGVLGPMRMPYGKTISVMRFLSGLLSDLVAETLVDES
jgi:heat-inducible transcriptional repressor